MTMFGFTVQDGQVHRVSRPLEPLSAGRVLVEITTAGICGSDLKAFLPGSSTLHRQAGVIGGHEGAGVVRAVGAGVEEPRVGEQVLVYSYEGCLACAHCRRGEPKLCPRAVATSVGRDGTWATHMVVAAASCRPLPPGLSALDAAVLACTGGTAAAAVLKTGPPVAGAALVIGLGPLGCAVAQLLSGLGSRVSGADPNSARLAHALRRGWIAAAAEPATDGGYPVVVETSGSVAGRDRAVRAAATAGTVVFVGLGAPTADLAVDITIRRELVLRGSHFWGLSTLDDIVGLYARAAARPADLVTAEYSLADLTVACREAATVAGKVVVRPAAAVGAP